MKTFTYEFEQDRPNRITFEYSPEGDEKLDTNVQEGIPFLSLNRPGMITLAQTLIKMANGEYSAGFHIHLRKDFDGDLPEKLAIVLAPDDAPPYK